MPGSCPSTLNHRTALVSVASYRTFSSTDSEMLSPLWQQWSPFHFDLWPDLCDMHRPGIEPRLAHFSCLLCPFSFHSIFHIRFCFSVYFPNYPVVVLWHVFPRSIKVASLELPYTICCLCQEISFMVALPGIWIRISSLWCPPYLGFITEDVGGTNIFDIRNPCNPCTFYLTLSDY